MRIYVYKKHKGWSNVMVLPSVRSRKRPVTFRRETKLDVVNRLREVLSDLSGQPMPEA